MKKILYSIMMIAMTAMMCTLPSCNDDDNDEPDVPKVDSSKKGWFKAEGKTTNFNYGLLYEYDDDEVAVMFSTINMLDMYMNPKKYVGKTVSLADIYKSDYYMGYDVYVDSKITGLEYDEDGEPELTSKNGKNYDGGDDFSFKFNLTSYSFSGSGLNAECYLETEDDIVDLDKTTKVDFEFSGKTEGILLDIDDLAAYSDVRSMESVEFVRISDPKVIKFIKNFMHPDAK